MSTADIIIICLAAATLGATVVGLVRASRARDEDLQARKEDRRARQEDRRTLFVVQRQPTQTGPDGRTPLHSFDVRALRAAARDLKFFWTGDDGEPLINSTTHWKSLVPGEWCPVNLSERPDVTVVYLNVEWTDDAGERQHDRIHELPLHGRTPAK